MQGLRYQTLQVHGLIKQYLPIKRKNVAERCKKIAV